MAKWHGRIGFITTEHILIEASSVEKQSKNYIWDS